MVPRIKSALIVVACALALPGCMTLTPAAYMVSPEAKAALSNHAGSRVMVSAIADPPSFNRRCRAVGDVQLPDGMGLGQFIAKGFNDELKYGGLLAQDGVRLSGKVTRAEFSSSAQLVNGWWDLGLSLESSNGEAILVESRHDFEAGFVGEAACNNASIALGPAVQKLVMKTITDPRFAALVR